MYETIDTFDKKNKGLQGKKGYLQSKLAKEVGVHHSIIGRYEREDAKPTIDVVKKLHRYWIPR